MDVLIVGAGPSGTWAACTLARRGARVTLIDPSHPREKPCGGGVTGRALALVAGNLDVEALPACTIRSARFTDINSGRQATVRLDDRGAARSRDLIVASRTEFDSRLLASARCAGVEVLAARVTDVFADAGGARVETTRGVRRASFLIGADGANSLVRRRLARPFQRAQLSIATGYFVHGVTSDEIVIELTSAPPGYIWSFPRPTHLAVGMCAQADAGITADQLRTTTLAWIRAAGLAVGGQLEPYSWPIPSLAARDFDTLEMSGPAWCLVGDAAGFVDPITREGIFFALLSGQRAAESIASTAAQPAARYAEAMRDEIVPELKRAACFKAGFFRPRFTRLMMRALQRSAAIRRVTADLVAGRQPYAGLRWRLLKTLEARVAWQLLVSRGI